MQRGVKPGWVRRLARDRIVRLFELAGQCAKARPDRAKRYVGLARRISSRYNVPLPGELKRRACRRCSAFLVPGRNLRVRALPRQRCTVYECLECGAVRRYGYARGKVFKRHRLK